METRPPKTAGIRAVPVQSGRCHRRHGAAGAANAETLGEFERTDGNAGVADTSKRHDCHPYSAGVADTTRKRDCHPKKTILEGKK